MEIKQFSPVVAMQEVQDAHDKAYGVKIIREIDYTSLIAGIEGMTYTMNVDEYLELVEKWEVKKYDQPFNDGYAQALKDIREKVVKPLYGKE